MRPPRGESQKKEENLTSGFGIEESGSLADCLIRYSSTFALLVC